MRRTPGSAVKLAELLFPLLELPEENTLGGKILRLADGNRSIQDIKKIIGCSQTAAYDAVKILREKGFSPKFPGYTYSGKYKQPS